MVCQIVFSKSLVRYTTALNYHKHRNTARKGIFSGCPAMLQRIPLSRPDEAIKAIEEDGGVILSDFTSLNDLDQVHQDVRGVMDARMRDKAS
jgi:hypothetical protein